MNYTPKVVKIALQSRLLILIIQYISNLIIPDHDADAFKYPGYNSTSHSNLVNHLLGGFLRWDAQYFIHIAKYGYTFENVLAFFPLYPYTVWFLSTFLSQLLSLVYFDSVLLFVAIFINLIFFCLSALTLFKLTEILFNDHLFAFKTVILFCLNPASVFFTAPYTECLFSYLSFKSMLNCVIIYQKYSSNRLKLELRDVLYLCPIGLSCITRSNGILNIGFFMYTVICLLLENFKLIQMKSIKLALKYIVFIFLALLLCLLPFITFQYYAYVIFCSDFTNNFPELILKHAKDHMLLLPGKFSEYKQSWCHNIAPLSYSHVQAKYWDVGFFKYYTFKQLPNFLLALPVITIVFVYSLIFFYKNFKLNLRSIFTFGSYCNKENVSIFNPVLMVYVVHAFCLTVFAVFFIHVQVTTRMVLSSSAVVYWYCAYQFSNIRLNKYSLCELFIPKARNIVQRWIKYYFLLYFFIGTVMFCNFLPWT